MFGCKWLRVIILLALEFIIMDLLAFDLRCFAISI